MILIPRKTTPGQNLLLPNTVANPRKNFFGMFIGGNRTGKSSMAKIYAEKYKAYNPENEIVAFDPQRKFNDIADDFIFATDKHWEQEIVTKRNCLIVFDDYKLINMQNQPAKALIQLMNFRAEWNVDLIFVTHSPNLVLTYLAYYITHYYIFYTQTQKDSFENKIPNYETCIRASRYINAYVREYGRGAWPNFPHVVVDDENDKMTFQYTEKDKLLKIITAVDQEYYANRTKRRR